jgi:hypothetical protein
VPTISYHVRLPAGPISYYAHLAKARPLLAQKRNQKALVEAERSLAINPGFIPTYQILTMGSLHLAQAKQALGLLTRRYDLAPGRSIKQSSATQTCISTTYAVAWLALSGCTTAQIAAITGHSPRDVRIASGAPFLRGSVPDHRSFGAQGGNHPQPPTR